MIASAPQARFKVRKSGVVAWRPRPVLPLPDWCERFVRLNPEWEATPGRYSVSGNPFWREILEAMTDHEVRQISVRKSTQIGGTLALIAALMGLSEIDPAPAMVVTPDELSAIELRDRVYGTCEQNEETRHKAPAERRRNTRSIDLYTMRAYMAWAGSAQRLRGRACKRVFRSEVDVYPSKAVKGGNPISASSERVKRFYESLIYDESSPSGSASIIHGMYEASDRRQWFVKCPHCGARQVLRFFTYRGGELDGRGGVAGYRDDDGNLFSEEAARANAHYVCIRGCTIDQSQKNAMVATGLWLPEGVTIDNRDIVSGVPVKSGRHRSYHLWSIHSPIITMADLAATYIERYNENNVRKFVEDWLGLQYQTRRSVTSWEKLGAKLQVNYPRGYVPESAWFLTAAVDVQRDGCFWVVRAWGDSSTSWLVDWGYIRRYQGSEEEPEDEEDGVLRSDLLELQRALIHRQFSVANGGVNPLGTSKLKIKLIGIDCNYFPRDVHTFVRHINSIRVRCIRGDNKLDPHERFRETVVEKPQRGGPKYSGDGMHVWGIFTVAYKEAIRDKWGIPTGRPGAWMLPAGIHRTGQLYLKQLINEQPFDEILDSGKRRTDWRAKNKQLGWDYWDDEVYAFALAEMVLSEATNKGLSWDSSSWPIPRSEEERKEQLRKSQPQQIPARDTQEY